MSTSDVATEVARLGGWQSPVNEDACCCWGVFSLPATAGIVIGLTALIGLIHEGAGETGAGEAATIAFICLTTLWACWHTTSAGLLWSLPILILSVALFAYAAFSSPDGTELSGWWALGSAAALGVHLIILFFHQMTTSWGRTFLTPLLIVGPLVVFSSWFWWDVVGLAGWGAVIIAAPLAIPVLIYGQREGDKQREMQATNLEQSKQRAQEKQAAQRQAAARALHETLDLDPDLDL